jgi:hypothetical protein
MIWSNDFPFFFFFCYCCCCKKILIVASKGEAPQRSILVSFNSIMLFVPKCFVLCVIATKLLLNNNSGLAIFLCVYKRQQFKIQDKLNDLKVTRGSCHEFCKLPSCEHF